MAVYPFTGTGVAIITPFKNDGSIDFHSLENLINYDIENGVDYIVALGTTGESVTLSKEEKEALINFIIEKVDKRVPLVVGLGGNNTDEVVNCIHKLEFDGIDGILSVCPYYNKPSQEGIYQHYKSIASVSPVPLILYNVPGRTGVNIQADTALRLAQIDNICAIKEASGNLPQVMKIIKNKPSDFLVVSGEDVFTLPIIAAGGNGVISVIANAMPKSFSTMVKKALNNETKEAAKINLQLLEIYENLFAEGNPAGVKAALNILGIIHENLRLPLVPVSKTTKDKLKKLIKQKHFSEVV